MGAVCQEKEGERESKWRDVNGNKERDSGGGRTNKYGRGGSDGGKSEDREE